MSKLTSMIFGLLMTLAAPFMVNAAEITLLPAVKLHIGDRDHRGNYWDGGHWRDHSWWKHHYEWRDNRWHAHRYPRPIPYYRDRHHRHDHHHGHHDHHDHHDHHGHHH